MNDTEMWTTQALPEHAEGEEADRENASLRYPDVDLGWGTLLVQQTAAPDDLPRFFVNIPFSDPDGVSLHSFIVAAENLGTAHYIATHCLSHWLAGIWDLDESGAALTDDVLAAADIHIGAPCPVVPFSEIYDTATCTPQVVEARVGVAKADKLAAREVGDAIEREEGLGARLAFEAKRSDVEHEEMHRRSRPSAFSKINPRSAA